MTLSTVPELKTAIPQLKLVAPDSERDAQLSWQIQNNNTTIGSINVELEETDFLESPAVHQVISDQAIDSKDVGAASMKAVLKYLYCSTTYPKIYSRHLVTDKTTATLLKNSGFKPLGKVYADGAGLTYQNVSLDNE